MSRIESKFKGRTFVVDFDDFCDEVVGTLEVLDKVKEENEDFKCTLFTIPMRTSAESIAEAKKRDYIALAPHGWWHTRGECLGWSKEEALDKINAAKEMGIDTPIFRAPAWLLDGDVYEACRELGYVVASHKDFRIENTGVSEYVYNDVRFRLRGTRGVHGHLTPVAGNFIVEMVGDGRLKFPPMKKRKFIDMVEAAVVG